ncbi:MAG TPA: SMC-Scp complex subunit ScpB, partial [Longimicrobiales bacterium]|nr:SMC-Scp complex subunit ScpB [Longimicrobiales bacterium]
MNVRQIVEAVLFASDAPLTASEIARSDESLDEDQVEEAIQLLRAEYDESGRAFQIVELAEGHQILTRPEFAPYLERFDNVPRPSRLSAPALETLAIIAYRQPIGRLEIEYIRGVTAAGVIRTLQERNLIEVVGRAEGLGRPLLYGTTRHFLEHFGFRSLEDLPRPEDLPVVLRERTPLGLEDETSADGMAAGESPADEVATDEAPADEPAVAGAPAADAPADDVSAEARSADEPAVAAAPADDAPADDVSAEARSADDDADVEADASEAD